MSDTSKNHPLLEKLFHLSEHQTDVRTEILAGLTTFMTMAYILAVNPSILADAGMDPTGVLVATALGSCIATAIMAFAANLPFALSAGMGLNAFMAYTVVQGMGMTWQVALFAVFVEGLIFLVLTFLKVREAIFNAIPFSLKLAVSAGIGLFICFIGLQNAGIAVDASTLVTITDFGADFHHAGICALLALVGTIITFVLYIREVRGSIFLGIVITWGLGMLAQLVGLYTPDPAAGFYSAYPSFGVTDFSAVSTTIGQCFHVNLFEVGLLTFATVVFAFLFVDVFDTIGTLIGGAERGGLLDEDGKLPNINRALLADSAGTSLGAFLGTSTITTYVESAAGIAVGGSTGLTALTIAVLFGLSSFFAPIFTSIPSFATTPALIVVGFLMLQSFGELNKLYGKDYTETVPAYICLISMPFFYSIAEGISLGAISYVLINLFCGKKEKLNKMLYILAIVFISKYIFL